MKRRLRPMSTVWSRRSTVTVAEDASATSPDAVTGSVGAVWLWARVTAATAGSAGLCPRLVRRSQSVGPWLPSLLILTVGRAVDRAMRHELPVTTPAAVNPLEPDGERR